MKPLRSKSEYEGNPVGLSEEACNAISDELDRHLSAYVVMFMQYHKYHWMVEGPQFRDLHLFLQEHYEEVNLDLDAIAERITLLGRTPSTRLDTYQAKSYAEQESEDVQHIRDSIAFAMENEQRICVEFRKTIHTCLQHDDFGTKKMVEGMLERAENRAHHLEHFLGEDTLTVGLIHEPTATADDTRTVLEDASSN